MLCLEVAPGEYFDERSLTFVSSPGAVVRLEHSLASLSKWESITHRSLLKETDLSGEDLLLYLECMCLDDPPSRDVLTRLVLQYSREVGAYMTDRQSASWFHESGKGSAGDTVTAEIIYYQMVALRIPFECQYWHLNRLLALIRTCQVKSESGRKEVSRSEFAAQKARARELYRRGRLG